MGNSNEGGYVQAETGRTTRAKIESSEENFVNRSAPTNAIHQCIFERLIINLKLFICVVVKINKLSLSNSIGSEMKLNASDVTLRDFM